MAKREDIKSVLIIGSGPIVIGQACEFDYSGVQACKALREEGYKVILVNSNPATIMTDPATADVTYIEPLTTEILTKIIEKERPDAVLPTLGGQTGLNLAMELDSQGIFEKYGVEMIGANAEIIDRAEDRDKFKIAIERIGLSVPKSKVARTINEALETAQEIGFPCIIRSAFTLGGKGGGVAYNLQEVEKIATVGLGSSRISEILIEQSILGWKEFELEVMRDKADNVLIVCSIENVDPMGIHTGDSITVAPIQTLSDVEYQKMRDAAIAIIREVGVETGGSNIQFAVNPVNGDMIVIEMNPRVSRSSALSSKATGFPIAKLAAKVAVGFTLDELKNDITVNTPASFEPTLDYCVVKIPRFNFEKFPQANDTLGVSMRSVGEVMSIGRTFKESLQKALRSMETKRFGFGSDPKAPDHISEADLSGFLRTPNPNRISALEYAFRIGWSVEKCHEITKIDPWFLDQMRQIVSMANTIDEATLSDAYALKRAKQFGFSDVQLATLTKKTEQEIRDARHKQSVIPTYKIVDTCSGEFEAFTPYFYSTYEQENEGRLSDKKKVLILGGGPNRIGQGIEFDYCCVHAVFASKELGYESIMVNSNPETVSTDYDTSDKLYFEPLTYEDVMNIYEMEKPEGIIIQFGGQTPLNLAEQLDKAGARILGTSYDSIDRAEDRDRFQSLLKKLNLKQPDNETAVTVDEAVVIANRIGYPVVVRPSYVLGGASMEIVYEDVQLKKYMAQAQDVSPERPVLIDKYLEAAIEIDVDAVSDGTDCVVSGVMEHIEEAGIHSGDSACVLPPYSISEDNLAEIRSATKQLAIELQVIGLLNIQFAIKDEEVYVLEVNPRGSRTVPFVSKTTGVPWAKIATRVMLGEKLADIGAVEVVPPHTAVKEAVFPFNRFPEVDTLLGPEMKSTGEVMGIDDDFGMAFIKSQIASGQHIPKEGTVFISVRESDKQSIVPIAKTIYDLGFNLIGTGGTADKLSQSGVPCARVLKVYEGRPNVVDEMKNGNVHLVINTPSGKNPIQDEIVIRQEANALNIPVITTIAGARATANALAPFLSEQLTVTPLQERNK